MPWHWTQLVRCRSAAFVVACGDANHNYLPSQGVWSGRNATAFSYITTPPHHWSRHHLRHHAASFLAHGLERVGGLRLAQDCWAPEGLRWGRRP